MVMDFRGQVRWRVKNDIFFGLKRGQEYVARGGFIDYSFWRTLDSWKKETRLCTGYHTSYKAKYFWFIWKYGSFSYK